MRRGNTINIYGKCTGPRNQFDISDRVEIGGVEITRVNCIWYDERYWSKILFTTIPSPGHDLGQGHRLRNFMLKFYIKVFKII